MSGSAEAVNAVVKGYRPSALPEAGQLSLLRDENGQLPPQAINLARRAGRPKGALNKRSKKIADYFVGKYGDPLDVLGNLMNTPLKDLVDVLIEADGGAEREAKLLEMCDEAVTHIKSLSKVGGGTEAAEELADAIEKLAGAAARISGKPGKLALDALALQISVAVNALEYVHGKQPISVDVTGKADLVIFAPEILKQYGIDGGELRQAVESRGLEAFDPDQMRLLGPDDDAAEDAEFSEVEAGEGTGE